MTLSDKINLLWSDPERDEDKFWRLVLRYIKSIVLNRGVRLDILDDIVAEVALKAITFHSDGRLGTNVFTRWLLRVARNEVNDFYNKSYKEIPVSQLLDEDEDSEGELEYLPNSTAVTLPVESSDAIVEEDKAKSVRDAANDAKLDDFQSLLSGGDMEYFSLYRQGYTDGEAQKVVGKNEWTLHDRLRSWRYLSARLERSKDLIRQFDPIKPLLSDKDLKLMDLLLLGRLPHKASLELGKSKHWASDRIKSWHGKVRRLKAGEKVESQRPKTDLSPEEAAAEHKRILDRRNYLQRKRRHEGRTYKKLKERRCLTQQC